jgi:hypothetical protein
MSRTANSDQQEPERDFLTIEVIVVLNRRRRLAPTLECHLGERLETKGNWQF